MYNKYEVRNEKHSNKMYLCSKLFRQLLETQYIVKMKQKKVIRKGSSDFKWIIDENGYFVGKTMLIKDFFNNGNYTILMPCSKRFGKILNLSMIKYFFDIQKNDTVKLFIEFEIANEKEFCKKHQNKYPVKNISLKKVKETNWARCFKKFKICISELYQKHKYLLKSDKLENKENPTYYEKVIGFMQSFLGEAFNGNEESLKKGLLTGVMHVGKESIFSEWNNFEVYGIISTYFADKFGFTRQEVKKIVTYFNLQDKINDVSKWYDGYKFGNVSGIYNPWSIVSYISNKNDGFKATG